MDNATTKDFVESQGAAFLPHLLRRLSDALVEGGVAWYAEQGLSIHPRASSTLLALDEEGSLSVTELSGLLNQSHPLIIQWISHLSSLNLVSAKEDPRDRRRTLISLTHKGRSEVTRLRRTLQTLEKATKCLMDEAMPGLFEALWKVERMNRTFPLIERLRSEKRSARASA